MAQSSAARQVIIVEDPSEIQLHFMTKETKEALQKIWSDLEFVGDEDVLGEFRCRQCQQIVLSHCAAASCKHVFCKECFNENNQKPCPVANCPNQSIDQGEPDLHLEVNLCKLRVKCIWQKYGCQEISSLWHLLDHQLKCPVFTQKLDPRMLQCNQLSDNVLQLRQTIMHLEHKIEKLEGAFSKNITNINDQLKANLITQEVELKMIEAVKPPSLTPDAFELLLKLNSTKFFWKVTGIQQLLREWKKNKKGEVLSDVFVTEEFGFQMRVKLKYYNETYLSVKLGFVQEGNRMPSHPSIYFHRRRFLLLDQSQINGEKRHIIRIRDPWSGQRTAQRWMKDYVGCDWFASMALLEKGAPYVVNDTIAIQIHIEPLSILGKYFASNDGILLWRIENYFAKKKDSIDRVVHDVFSDYFYSSQGGYRMRIRFFLNFSIDADKGIFLDFRRGEWDDFLPEKFPHKTTIMILDQSDSNEKTHLIKTKVSESTEQDHIGNFPNSQIEASKYLKDNCLMLKVIVEPRELLNKEMDLKGVEQKIIELVKDESLNCEYLDCHLEVQRTEFLWKIAGIQKLIKEWKNNRKGVVSSDVLITKQFNMQMIARLDYYNEEWLSLRVGFVREGISMLSDPTVYFHRRTCFLLDQSKGNGEKRPRIRISEPWFGKWGAKRWLEDFNGWNEFLPVKLLENGGPYVVDDAIAIQILIEPLSILGQCFASNNGTLLWRIENYSKIKQDSKDGLFKYLYSDYFYSSQRGYRLQIRLHLDIDGNIQMCVDFKRGEWDDSLPERFPHKNILMILDQSDSSERNHLFETEESKAPYTYHKAFFSHSQIEAPKYLKDDCLLLKAIVESNKN